VHVCLCMRTCTQTCVWCGCAYMCACACALVCACGCAQSLALVLQRAAFLADWIQRHMHVNAQRHIDVHAWVCTEMCMRSDTCMCTHRQVYAQRHMHVCAQGCVCTDATHMFMRLIFHAQL